MQHQVDLENDKFIMNSDILAVQETWMEQDPQPPISVYPHQYYAHGRIRGVALLSQMQPKHVDRIQTENCSVIKAEFENFDLFNIYRFSNSNIIPFIENIMKMLDPTRTQVLLGDFKLDLLKQPNNQFARGMIECSFKQIVKDPTHLQVLILLLTQTSNLLFILVIFQFLINLF